MALTETHGKMRRAEEKVHKVKEQKEQLKEPRQFFEKSHWLMLRMMHVGIDLLSVEDEGRKRKGERKLVGALWKKTNSFFFSL